MFVKAVAGGGGRGEHASEVRGDFAVEHGATLREADSTAERAALWGSRRERAHGEVEGTRRTKRVSAETTATRLSG